MNCIRQKRLEILKKNIKQEINSIEDFFASTKTISEILSHNYFESISSDEEIGSAIICQGLRYFAFCNTLEGCHNELLVLLVNIFTVKMIEKLEEIYNDKSVSETNVVGLALFYKTTCKYENANHYIKLVLSNNKHEPIANYLKYSILEDEGKIEKNKEFHSKKNCADLIEEAIKQDQDQDDIEKMASAMIKLTFVRKSIAQKVVTGKDIEQIGKNLIKLIYKNYPSFFYQRVVDFLKEYLKEDDVLIILICVSIRIIKNDYEEAERLIQSVKSLKPTNKKIKEIVDNAVQIIERLKNRSKNESKNAK